MLRKTARKKQKKGTETKLQKGRREEQKKHEGTVKWNGEGRRRETNETRAAGGERKGQKLSSIEGEEKSRKSMREQWRGETEEEEKWLKLRLEGEVWSGREDDEECEMKSGRREDEECETRFQVNTTLAELATLILMHDLILRVTDRRSHTLDPLWTRDSTWLEGEESNTGQV